MPLHTYSTTLARQAPLKSVCYSVREAKNALEYAATISAACAVDCKKEETGDDSGSETGSESAEQLQRDLQFWCGKGGGDMKRRKAATSLVENLLGSESKKAWEAIHTATSKAAQSIGTSKDGDSDGVRIFCSDEPFKAEGGMWKDPTGRTIDLGIRVKTRVRLCETKVLGLAIARAKDPKKGILLCNRPRPAEAVGSLEYTSKDIESQDYLFSRLNYGANKEEIDVDRLAKFISSELIYELIHLGDSTQFPLMISPGIKEVYEYQGCRDIAGTEIKWKNCDTFALIAQAIYINSYYTDGNKMKLLPENLRPALEHQNRPLKKSIQQ